MRISASIGSWTGDEAKNIDLLRSLDIDRIHIDVFDDPDSLPKINFSNSPIPGELHIVSSKPEAFYSSVSAMGISRVIFQFENLPEGWIPTALSGAKLGLSVLPETDFKKIQSVSHHYDYLVVMATVPGISGQPFNLEAFAMVEEIRAKLPEMPLHVDGGVSPSLIPTLDSSGVREVVLGSFLANSTSHVRDYLVAKYGLKMMSDNVRKAMMPGNASPTLMLQRGKTTISDLVGSIEQAQRGFLIVIDEESKCLGVITEGDIRRMISSSSIVTSKDSLSTDLHAKIREKSFAYVSESDTLLHAFEESTRLRQDGKVINFLPVLSEHGKFVGVLDFRRIHEEMF